MPLWLGLSVLRPTFQSFNGNSSTWEDKLSVEPHSWEMLDGKGEPTFTGPFAALDKHAVSAPKSVEKTIPTLVAYLIGPAKTETEKARVIFTWIAHRIRYADDIYNSGSYADSDMTFKAVLKRRTAICQGYANLFQAMCQEAQLTCEIISGYSKTPYSNQVKFAANEGHAWNAVKLGDRWALMDPTWSAGSGTIEKGKLISTPFFNDFWFDTDPKAMIISHFPDLPQNQFLSTPISKEDFQAYPFLFSSAFEFGLDPSVVWAKIQENPKVVFPSFFTKEVNVTLLNPIYEGELKAGTEFYLEIQSSDWAECGFNNGGTTTIIQPDAKGVFRIKCVLKPGFLQIGGTVNAHENLSTIVKFTVVP